MTQLRTIVPLILVIINTKSSKLDTDRYQLRLDIPIPSFQPKTTKLIEMVEGIPIYEIEGDQFEAFSQIGPKSIFISRFVSKLEKPLEFIKQHELGHLFLNHSQEKAFIGSCIMIFETLFKKKSVLRIVLLMYGIWFPYSRMLEYEADFYAFKKSPSYEWMRQMNDGYSRYLWPSHPSYVNRFNRLHAHSSGLS